MQEAYITRINNILAYIDRNLHEELSLQQLAEIAHYSPFHVHRLFKAITNETLLAYITRKRIERTALMLIHHQEYSISDIATKYGFRNDSTYSRTFKKIYGQSPTEFRKANRHNFSKIGKEPRKNGQEDFITAGYLRRITHLKNWIDMNAKIEIREMPSKNLAYITQIGVEGIEDTFMRVVKWAIPKGLLQQPHTHLCRVFHDSFKVTDEDKIRMSIGILTDQEIQVDGEVSLTTLSRSRCIVARFEIEPVDLGESWDSLFIWMSAHGYKKAAGNPYEKYHNNYMDHPEKKCVVDLLIPIQ